MSVYENWCEPARHASRELCEPLQEAMQSIEDTLKKIQNKNQKQ